MMGLVVVFVLIFLAVAIVAVIYNRMVALRNLYKNAFSQIDIQLKRRHDLIPNLVEAARGYLKHERETLESVINARNTASQAAGRASENPGSGEAIRRLTGAETALGGALGRLYAVMENYPELKANETIQRLTEEITATENRISFARQAFNDAVTAYNIYCESFPAVVLAGPFGFEGAQLLEIEGDDFRGTPAVAFA